MTDQEQNIAIAEWCGISPCEVHKSYTCDCGYCYPDYATDLNAMWEAEEKLDANGWDSYVMNLVGLCARNSKWDACSTDEEFAIIHATARQRAEALLKTLGRWVDK